MESVRVTEQLLKVLEELLRDPAGQHHGYDIILATKLKSGTLYPLLVRLERAGWLTSDWQVGDNDGRPRRRFYRFTGEGEIAARQALAESRASLPIHGRVGDLRWI